MMPIMRPGISDEEIKVLKRRGACAATTEPCYWRRDRLCYFKGYCKDKLPLGKKEEGSEQK